MGSVYLNGSDPAWPSLLDVVRSVAPQATGWSGWEWRSRSSGGFGPQGPMALVMHHTASPARGTPGDQYAADAQYCAVGHPDSPVGSGVIGPEGQVSIHAAGSANHAGAGGPWDTSRGRIGQDAGNANTVAFEMSNDGQGQVWPAAQCEVAVAVARAVADAYGLRLDRWATFGSDILSHEEWTRPSCPGRKCDPAGPSPWSPKAAGGCSAGNLWNMDAFRASVAMAGADQEENDMAGWLYRDTAYSNVFCRGQGPAQPVTTEELQSGIAARLGGIVEARHVQTLESICQQAWGCTTAEAVERRYLV